MRRTLDELVLTESQADVVAFLRDLPSAHIVRVRSETSVYPGAKTVSDTVKITGGGCVTRPCPCGAECGHRQRVSVDGSFMWSDGVFSSAVTSARGQRSSITQAKRDIQRRLETETATKSTKTPDPPER